MESENPTDRPESPKKKLKSSSSVENEVTFAHKSEVNKNVTDKIKSHHNTEGPTVNGVPELTAPSRKGRAFSTVDSSSEHAEVPSVSDNDSQSIQEEVVSSSENAVCALTPEHDDGDADSISYEPAEESFEPGESEGSEDAE